MTAASPGSLGSDFDEVPHTPSNIRILLHSGGGEKYPELPPTPSIQLSEGVEA